MKRYIAILAAAVLVPLSGTITAQAMTSPAPGHLTAAYSATATDLSAARTDQVQARAAAIRAVELAAEHTAHLGHLAHLAHLATLTAQQASMMAVTPISPPAGTGDGDGLPPGGAYCKPDCWGDGDGDGFDLSHSPFASAPAAAPVSAPVAGDHEPDGDSDDPATAPAQAPVQAPVAAAVSAPVSSASSGNVNPSSYSGYEACVVQRESGGNPTAVNASSGAGGLFQFLPSTWASLGYSGLPQNAPVAIQNQAFQKLYAQAGTSPWSPSDHC